VAVAVLAVTGHDRRLCIVQAAPQVVGCSRHLGMALCWQSMPQQIAANFAARGRLGATRLPGRSKVHSVILCNCWHRFWW